MNLVGGVSYLRWGYWGPGRIHIQGVSGPRGGRRTVCGRNIPSSWDRVELMLPVDSSSARWYERNRWGSACTECKDGVMRL